MVASSAKMRRPRRPASSVGPGERGRRTNASISACDAGCAGSVRLFAGAGGSPDESLAIEKALYAGRQADCNCNLGGVPEAPKQWLKKHRRSAAKEPGSLSGGA